MDHRAGIEALGEDISNFSVFQAPPPKEALYPTEDIGTGWYVNAHEHPDVAADLLNFCSSARRAAKRCWRAATTCRWASSTWKVWSCRCSSRRSPSPTSTATTAPIHAFLDTVTPASMTDVTYDGLQALLAGQMSPEDFTAAVEVPRPPRRRTSTCNRGE